MIRQPIPLARPFGHRENQHGVFGRQLADQGITEGLGGKIDEGQPGAEQGFHAIHGQSGQQGGIVGPPGDAVLPIGPCLQAGQQGELVPGDLSLPIEDRLPAHEGMVDIGGAAERHITVQPRKVVHRRVFRFWRGGRLGNALAKQGAEPAKQLEHFQTPVVVGGEKRRAGPGYDYGMDTLPAFLPPIASPAPSVSPGAVQAARLTRRRLPPRPETRDNPPLWRQA